MEARPVRIRRVNVVRVEPPHIAFRRVRPRGAGGVDGVCGGEKDSIVASEEVATGGLAGASRYAVLVRPIHIHDVLLIARPPIARRLENQAFSVVTEIGFRILPTKGELSDVPEVRLRWCESKRPGALYAVVRRGRALHGAAMRENGRRPDGSDGRHELRNQAGHTMHAPNLERLCRYCCRLACAVGILAASVEAMSKRSFWVVPLSSSSIALRSGASYGKSRRFAD